MQLSNNVNNYLNGNIDSIFFALDPCVLSY